MEGPRFRRDYLLSPETGLTEAVAGPILRRRWQNYSVDGRYHHGPGHPAWMLRYYDLRLGEIKNPRVLGWFALFHDDYMDFMAKPGENEEISAISAEYELEGLLPGIELDLIGNAIRTSADHPIITDDPDLAIGMDSDMAILGAPTPIFEQYRRNIRLEYRFAPESAFVARTIEFLEPIANGKQIFSTDYGLEVLQPQAVTNAQQEVQRLQAA